LPVRATVDRNGFNSDADLPYALRLQDFEMAMQDIYDFLHDVNQQLLGKGLPRLEEMVRAAILSGFISDMVAASMAKHARTLCHNNYPNGHPDLLVQGVYANNSVKSGTEGVEIKSTQRRGGAVDTHGARAQWMCVFVYEADCVTEPARHRRPTRFREVYLGKVEETDFRKNPRGELGTRTATLHREGVQKLRSNWVYRSE
jgi:hypothetical protein